MTADELLAAARQVHVRLERTSERDSVGGAVYTGWEFSAGDGDDTILVRFSDTHGRGDLPELFGLGQEGLPLAWIQQVLPALIALICDERVVAAGERWADGLLAIGGDQ